MIDIRTKTKENYNGVTTKLAFDIKPTLFVWGVHNIATTQYGI